MTVRPGTWWTGTERQESLRSPGPAALVSPSPPTVWQSERLTRQVG